MNIKQKLIKLLAKLYKVKVNEMEKIGEAFIEGRVVNLDSTNVKDLETFLGSVRKQKEDLKE